MSTDHQASLIYGFLVERCEIENPVTECDWQLKLGTAIIAVGKEDDFCSGDAIDGLEIYDTGVYASNHQVLGVLVAEVAPNGMILNISTLMDLSAKSTHILEFSKRYSAKPNYFLMCQGY